MALNLNYEAEIYADTSKMSRTKWLETRRAGIGGSEASIVMGVSPFATKRDLYYDKLGIKPVSQNPEEENWVAKDVGNRLEELVAIIFSKKTGLQVYPDKNMYQHPIYPFMKADVDYIVAMPDGSKAILECKTCNYNSQWKWKDNQVPENYLWQGRHYLSVKNYQTVFFACLYGNNESEFIIRKVERDLALEEELIQAEQRFWMEYVEKGVEPPYEEAPDMVLESIRKFTGEPDLNLPVVPLDDMAGADLERYLMLSEEKAELEKRKREIDKEQKTLSIPFVTQMGTGCKAFYSDGQNKYQVTYNPSYRRTVNKENIQRLENLYPEVFEEVVTESMSRTFRVKKEAA